LNSYRFLSKNIFRFGFITFFTIALITSGSTNSQATDCSIAIGANARVDQEQSQLLASADAAEKADVTRQLLKSMNSQKISHSVSSLLNRVINFKLDTKLTFSREQAKKQGEYLDQNSSDMKLLPGILKVLISEKLLSPHYSPTTLALMNASLIANERMAKTVISNPKCFTAINLQMAQIALHADKPYTNQLFLDPTYMANLFL